MEIRRLGGNRIRCALTESEIEEMGFSIEEIIENSEVTQRFMRGVLTLVEEQENINLENVSPVARAELLQDHSMAITFGGDSDQLFKSLVDTVSQLVGQMDPGKLEELIRQSREGRAARELLESAGDARQTGEKRRPDGRRHRGEPMLCALQFEALEDVIRMSRVCFPDRKPKSSLYKYEEVFYLLLDFSGFTKEEMRPFALGAAEYDNGRISEDARIAHIREHGKCIVRSDAIGALTQL